MARRRYRKTPTMLLLEARDTEQRDVAQIMLDAYQQTGSDASAAQSIGITQQAFNIWKYRLGLEKRIDEIAFSLKYGTSVADNNDSDAGRTSNAP